MLLGMIRLLASLIERRQGPAPAAVDSFLCPTPKPGLPTRNEARRIALPSSDTVPSLAPKSAVADACGGPGSVGPSLRQLWAELAQRQVRTFLIQEKEHDDI
jgi:hypothetical protein